MTVEKGSVMVDPLEEQIAEAKERFEAWQAMQELKRRYPEPDGGTPCPDCGSLEHFEC